MQSYHQLHIDKTLKHRLYDDITLIFPGLKVWGYLERVCDLYSEIATNYAQLYDQLVVSITKNIILFNMIKYLTHICQ